MARVPVACVTDPWSVGAWAAQPRGRRLLAQSGDDLAVTYVMAPPPGDPGRRASWWLDLATPGVAFGSNAIVKALGAQRERAAALGAAAELCRLAMECRLTPVRVLGGELWRAA